MDHFEFCECVGGSMGQACLFTWPSPPLRPPPPKHPMNQQTNDPILLKQIKTGGCLKIRRPYHEIIIFNNCLSQHYVCW